MTAIGFSVFPEEWHPEHHHNPGEPASLKS